MLLAPFTDRRFAQPDGPDAPRAAPQPAARDRPASELAARRTGRRACGALRGCGRPGARCSPTLLRAAGRRCWRPADYGVDSPLKRLALLDGAVAAPARRLARPVRARAAAAAARARLASGCGARRGGSTPTPWSSCSNACRSSPGCRWPPHPSRSDPASRGRVLVDRGYRLLLALAAPEGEAALQRVAAHAAAPRRALPVPPLAPRQTQQLARADALVHRSRKAGAMGLAFLITTENLQLLSERKVFKEAEYAALLDASAVLDAARAEARRIVDQAAPRPRRRRRQGYAEGLQQRPGRIREQLVSDALATERQLQALRASMAHIVVKAVGQFMAEVDPARCSRRRCGAWMRCCAPSRSWRCAWRRRRRRDARACWPLRGRRGWRIAGAVAPTPRWPTAPASCDRLGHAGDRRRRAARGVPPRGRAQGGRALERRDEPRRACRPRRSTSPPTSSRRSGASCRWRCAVA